MLAERSAQAATPEQGDWPAWAYTLQTVPPADNLTLVRDAWENARTVWWTSPYAFADDAQLRAELARLTETEQASMAIAILLTAGQRAAEAKASVAALERWSEARSIAITEDLPELEAWALVHRVGWYLQAEAFDLAANNLASIEMDTIASETLLARVLDWLEIRLAEAQGQWELANTRRADLTQRMAVAEVAHYETRLATLLLETAESEEARARAAFRAVEASQAVFVAEQRASTRMGLLLVGLALAALVLAIGLIVWSFQTKRKQAIIEHLESSLEESQAKAEQRRAEAARAQEAKSSFFATMSHEIRTPLNAVLGMAAILRETTLDQDQREYVGSISSAGKALLSVLNNALDYAKMEAGQLQLESEDFDVVELLEEIEDIFRGEVRRRGLLLSFDLADDTPRFIRGDSARLRQILLNLVGNAVKFTSDGQIEIFVRPVQKEREAVQLEWQVRDSGIGIAEEVQAKIFEPFQQGDGSHTRRFGGTGLGLNIARRLIELMEGRLWFETELNTGTTFFFTTAHRTAAKPEPLPASLSLARRQVLVVDDNATNRQILRIYLQQAEISVVEASSASRALQLLHEMPHLDAALLDLQMPEVDGLSLARDIRQLDGHRDLPLLVLSSVDDPQIRRDSRRLGLVDFLFKPVKRELLLDVLKRTMWQQPKAESPPDVAAPAPLRSRVKPSHFLIVEDNPMNRKVMSAYLETLQLSWDAVDNGEEALEQLQKKHYDAVLLDLHMPGLDGWEVNRRMRELPIPTPLVIVVTAALDGDVPRKASAEGVAMVLPKPVLLDSFRDALDECSLLPSKEV